MRLRIDRVGSNSRNTFGLWFVDSDFFAFSIEDAYHEVKIPGQTRIPAGVYEVALTYSNKFKRNMWEILHVKNYTGIRIHPLTTAEDTEGCVGCGWDASLNLDGISHIAASNKAYEDLCRRMEVAANAGEKIKIKISDELLERSDTNW